MDLTDEQWAILDPLIPDPPVREDGRGRPWKEKRPVLNGILWILRTGAPWRDLPDRYPPHGTCSDRLYRWPRTRVREQVLPALLAQADANGELAWVHAAVDSTTVRAHQHAAGARKAPGKRGNS